MQRRKETLHLRSLLYFVGKLYHRIRLYVWSSSKCRNKFHFRISSIKEWFKRLLHFLLNSPSCSLHFGELHSWQVSSLVSYLHNSIKLGKLIKLERVLFLLKHIIFRLFHFDFCDLLVFVNIDECCPNERCHYLLHGVESALTIKNWNIKLGYFKESLTEILD